MTAKVFRSIMIVAGVVLLASLLIIMGCLYNYFGGVQETQLKDELEIASVAVEDSGIQYLEQLKSDRYRITWISPNGAVIYDTQKDAAGMGNHGDREEIQQALATGHGESIRYSSTLLEKTIYSAKRLSDGTVLRISLSRATAGFLAFGMLQPILIVLVLALILSGLLAGRISRRIVEPLNRLDLTKPLENNTYEELSPLLHRLNRQQNEISSQLLQLRHQRAEFAQIIRNMREGLLLLDSKGAVMSINPMAQRLFGTDASCVGNDFLTVERSPDITRCVSSAMESGHSEIRIDRMERRYQLDISRIESEGAVIGAVLLAFDVSEQEFSERARQEFTANVSHELKTPLQSIMGSAELMENNLVKQEDMPRFVGHIRKESARLLALIEDIIRLSQLDEGDEMPKEDISLFELAGEVAANLSEAAEAKQVSLSVSGEDAVIPGVRRLLYEIVFNLCDNSIKYNVEGGSVEVTVSSDDQNAVIAVRDTGIGISEEHQDRVFERFYRVDKSHSKASGGTGLGLSIVKHAVQYHNGKIALQSKPGQGTEIRVTFPKES